MQRITSLSRLMWLSSSLMTLAALFVYLVCGPVPQLRAQSNDCQDYCYAGGQAYSIGYNLNGQYCTTNCGPDGCACWD
jgi:hypothetical protein